MLKKWIVALFILLSVSVSNAVERAERISDREIIEGLTTLKEGQKVLNQRLDEVKLEIKDVRTEIKGFMIWGFGVTFAGMWTLIGFVLWDRRTALAPAVMKNKELEEREEVLEKWKKKVDMVFEKLAGGDVKVADALRQVGMM